MSYLFISHNLAVVEHVSHDVAVMYLGRIVEHTDKATIFARPLHPYTQALMAAVPVADPTVRRTKKHVMGDVPSPINRAVGLPFPSALPDGAATMPERGARPAGSRSRPSRRLSPCLINALVRTQIDASLDCHAMQRCPAPSDRRPSA